VRGFSACAPAYLIEQVEAAAFQISPYHWPVIGWKEDIESFTLDEVKTHHRLYQNLVWGKKLVLDADAENSLLSKDSNLFYVSAELAPGKEIGEVEHALFDEIQILQKEPVGIHELEKIKNQIEAAFIYSQDSIFTQAMILGQYEIVTGWRTVDNYLPSIQKVAPEDIQRVAKKYLIQDNRTVGILIPLPQREKEPSQPEVHK